VGAFDAELRGEPEGDGAKGPTTCTCGEELMPVNFGKTLEGERENKETTKSTKPC
jgi:hypothetical protein